MQNVASYLALDLGVDWRYGADHFESLLLDHDVASNWGNWWVVYNAKFVFVVHAYVSLLVNSVSSYLFGFLLCDQSSSQTGKLI